MNDLSVRRQETGGEAGGERAHVIDRRAGRRRGDRIVGGGRATQEAVDRALAAARSERPVWLSGPPGVGKEHLARAIHSWSPRAAEPFAVVSCSSISEALLAREIFGCAAGAQAGRPEESRGALARAGGGTLFVDDFDGAPASLRGALLRALGEGRFRREGDAEAQPLRARVMLTTAGAEPPGPLGDLPHDAIALTPLAERREDVLPLAAHFLRLAADDAGVEPVGFTSDARDALLAEEWRGNVRELGERVRQAVKLAGKGAISAEALLLAADGEDVPSFKEAKRAFETRYVVGLLRRCQGNISHAARLAKKDRKDFYDVIRRTGVNPSDFR